MYVCAYSLPKVGPHLTCTMDNTIACVAAFFFCGIDGASLCLQCDVDVHVGVKKSHERYLLTGQRVEARVFFPFCFTVVFVGETCLSSGFKQ